MEDSDDVLDAVEEREEVAEERELVVLHWAVQDGSMRVL